MGLIPAFQYYDVGVFANLLIALAQGAFHSETLDDAISHLGNRVHELIKYDVGIPILKRARPAIRAAVQFMEHTASWDLWLNPTPSAGAVTKK